MTIVLTKGFLMLYGGIGLSVLSALCLIITVATSGARKRKTLEKISKQY